MSVIVNGKEYCCQQAADKALAAEAAEAAKEAEKQNCCCSPAEQSADQAEKQDCCCSGDTSESCCSDSAYSCEDDPFLGHKKTVIVDFLFLDLSTCDRCQGADERVAKAVEKCRPVLEACGYNLVLNQIEVDDEGLAERYRFYSSPTVRVNGVDVCPSVEENDCGCCSDMSGADIKCRIFPFNDTYYEVPPTDMLVANIVNTVIKGMKAEPEEGPYVLPENLASFFEGKRAKDAEKA